MTTSPDSVSYTDAIQELLAWPGDGLGFIHVKDMGAVGDGVADDTYAFSRAIRRSNTLLTAGVSAVIFVPAGVYKITSALPQFQRGGSLVGEGVHRSYIKVATSYSGDVFSWTDAWMASDWPISGTADPSPMKLSAMVTGLTVIGDQSTANGQNAFVFYDHCDRVVFRDVSAWYMNGYGLAMGIRQNDASAYLRESRFYNCSFWSCGTSTKPAVFITAQGSAAAGADPSNEIEFHGLDILRSVGVGLKIQNETGGSAGGVRYLRFFGCRVERSTGNQDLIVIGDTTAQGTLSGLHFFGLDVEQIPAGKTGVRITANSSTYMPYDIQFHGATLGGTGDAFTIDYGRSILMLGVAMNASGNVLTVGPSTQVGNRITIDAGGSERALTYSIDASAAKYVRTPGGLCGDLGGNIGFASNYHDSSASFGNAVGAYAIDLSLIRDSAGQTATGQYATILGGRSNTASGINSTIVGGSNNVASGARSTCLGGVGGTDRTRNGTMFFTGGTIATTGDAQLFSGTLCGTGNSTTAIRLTTDGSGSATSANTMSLANNSAYTFRVSLHARNVSTPGSDYSWTLPNGMISRDANAASTAVSLGTPVTLTRGTTAGASVSCTADTTNGSLNVSFTPPGGNTDTWHIVARIDAAEVL